MLQTTRNPSEQSAVVSAVLARRLDEPGALLPILHDVQHALGYVPAHVVPEIASALNLSRAEVHGVVTYYHHFRSEPAARHVIQICRAEACQSMGADALMAHAELQLGCTPAQAHAHAHAHGQTHGGMPSADGVFTLEPVYCLGLCASSPAMTIDDEVHARVTPRGFDRLVADLRSGA